MGHGDSRYISLQEQLTIFLYACVTGLPIHHLGFNSQMRQFPSEYFVQYCHCYLSSLFHRYFCKITQIFAFAPFNSKYVKQVSPEDPPSSFLSNNPRLWPFLAGHLAQLMVATSMQPPMLSIVKHVTIRRVSYHRTVCSAVPLIFSSHMSLLVGKDQHLMPKFMKVQSLTT